jgi:hypothetical protein
VRGNNVHCKQRFNNFELIYAFKYYYIDTKMYMNAEIKIEINEMILNSKINNNKLFNCIYQYNKKKRLNIPFC